MRITWKQISVQGFNTGLENKPPIRRGGAYEDS
jgi:hypothetical protein